MSTHAARAAEATQRNSACPNPHREPGRAVVALHGQRGPLHRDAGPDVGESVHQRVGGGRRGELGEEPAQAPVRHRLAQLGQQREIAAARDRVGGAQHPREHVDRHARGHVELGLARAGKPTDEMKYRHWDSVSRGERVHHITESG